MGFELRSRIPRNIIIQVPKECKSSRSFGEIADFDEKNRKERITIRGLTEDDFRTSFSSEIGYFQGDLPEFQVFIGKNFRYLCFMKVFLYFSFLFSFKSKVLKKPSP